jgi:hypothetical protein
MTLNSHRIRAALIADLLALLFLLASTTTAQTPGTFAPTGSMITPRALHSATLLLNGKVLITRGTYSADKFSPYTAELYDPATRTFTATGDSIYGGDSPTLLPDGRVLFVGGTSAELYDPSTGTFTATGGTTTAAGIATLLGNGNVLIAGNAAQLYDPATATFASTGAYAGAFYPETATLLPDGRVLLVGNADNDGAYLEHEELYDPVTGKFKLTGKTHTYGFGSDIWAGHTATLLQNGKVLLAGGANEDFGTFSIAELYDPSTDTFTATANMTTPRAGHTATLLPDGTVLLAGGQLTVGITSAEIYNPATGTFSATGNMTTPRFWHAATLLPDGTVLMTGGDSGGAVVLASAEIYTPAVLVPASPWQQAITALKIAAGTDSYNFWQWDWLWQRTPSFPGAPASFGVLGSIDNTPGLLSEIIAAGGGNGIQSISAEQWVAYYRQVIATDPWQQAIARMQASAGTDSYNFWQWAWFWQRSPTFAGAPAGFGVLGSIDNTPATISAIIAAGGGNGLALVSAGQWVQYYRQATCAGCWDY